MDKQPEMHGWRDGFGPWTPVIEGDRLYGRGGADDEASGASLGGNLGAHREGGALDGAPLREGDGGLGDGAGLGGGDRDGRAHGGGGGDGEHLYCYRCVRI